jgi:uncharacterized protein YndB with AHSA1/START domain
MAKRSVTIEIGAPPMVVYDLWIDAGRFKEWQGGVKAVTASGSLADPGTRYRTTYGWPFRVSGEVLAVEPGVRHESRAKEMLGFVTCITTASFEPAGAGTRLTVEFDSTVAGGPIGRAIQGKVGEEMVGTFGKDAARLKALAEGIGASSA